MEFLNRDNEIKRLARAINSEDTKLIVVYGRRRLGKTRLLQQIIQKDDIYYIADQRESPVEIDIVANSRDNKQIIIGEAKWSSTRNVSKLLKQLDKKAENFAAAKNKTIKKALFLKEKPKHIPKDCYIFSPEDIVEAYRVKNKK